MPSSALSNFFAHATSAVHEAGDLIFTEDDPANGCMYVILEGDVSLVRQGVQLERLSSEGAVFGELALIDQLPRTATARAERPTRLAVITEERFRELTLRNPSFALEMMRLLSRRARRNLHG